MFNSLQIGNFKAFGETQNIPLRPITLIFGANSSGKSSIIHGLSLIHEALRTGELDVALTQLGGASIDLGGFRQYIHRREADRKMLWSITIPTSSLDKEIKAFLGQIDSIEIKILIGLPLNKDVNAVPCVISYTIATNRDVLLQIARKANGIAGIEFVSDSLFKMITEDFFANKKINQNEAKQLEKSANEITKQIKVSFNGIMPNLILNADQGKGNLFEYGKLLSSISMVSPLAGTAGLFGKIIYDALKNKKDVESESNEKVSTAYQLYFLSSLKGIIENISKQLKEEILQLNYLGPLRSYPARHFSFAEHDEQNWTAGGGYTWDIVLRNPKIRDKVNAWLGDENKLRASYQLSIRELLPFEDLDEGYRALVSMLEEAFVNDDWSEFEKKLGIETTGDLFGEIGQLLKRCREKEARYPRKKELVLIDNMTGTQLSNRDVGVGISQVLPVLVSSYALTNKIIAIEQPELHLHPALQAELGDVFIESALAGNNNRFLLETHSEHLILRILRRIRETYKSKNTGPAITNKDVAVLYITPNKSGSKVTELPITEDGDFEVEWPEGFFEEREEELLY